MSEVMPPLVYQLGLGGVDGFIVDFALKKLTKLLRVIMGLFVLARLYLGVNGVINVYYGALWNTIADRLG
jgi:uncharacterized membrane protein (Fun14 family)